MSATAVCARDIVGYTLYVQRRALHLSTYVTTDNRCDERSNKFKDSTCNDAAAPVGFGQH